MNEKKKELKEQQEKLSKELQKFEKVHLQIRLLEEADKVVLQRLDKTKGVIKERKEELKQQENKLEGIKDEAGHLKSSVKLTRHQSKEKRPNDSKTN